MRYFHKVKKLDEDASCPVGNNDLGLWGLWIEKAHSKWQRKKKLSVDVT